MSNNNHIANEIREVFFNYNGEHINKTFYASIIPNNDTIEYNDDINVPQFNSLAKKTINNNQSHKRVCLPHSSTMTINQCDDTAVTSNLQKEHLIKSFNLKINQYVIGQSKRSKLSNTSSTIPTASSTFIKTTINPYSNKAHSSQRKSISSYHETNYQTTLETIIRPFSSTILPKKNIHYKQFLETIKKLPLKKKTKDKQRNLKDKIEGINSYLYSKIKNTLNFSRQLPRPNCFTTKLKKHNYIFSLNEPKDIIEEKTKMIMNKEKSYLFTHVKMDTKPFKYKYKARQLDNDLNNFITLNNYRVII